ncbi:MAG: hypothetical protein ACREK5_04690 [Gemmatimonadota bacterium]
MEASFVDHVQLLPLPTRDGVRQPDGAHRPGGLGLRDLSDRLGERGWTARIEDFAIERRLAEARLAEAYARAIGDAVTSAHDRNRFPIVLGLVNYCALGIVDGLGPGVGVVWVSPEGGYRRTGWLRRAPVDSSVLARVTGRQKRDTFAISPVALPGSRIVVVGGQRIPGGEAAVMQTDGVRRVGPAELDELPTAVAAADADTWYLHIDASVFASDALPAADEAATDGLHLGSLARAVEHAFEGRSIGCLAVARYDLNREADTSLSTITALLDRLLLAAGGQPSPTARRETEAR